MADLRCQGLAKSYGVRAVLRDVDLIVPSGTLTAILGASGSGKTTLLRVIMGFIETDAGTVAVGGTTVADAGRTHVTSDKRAIGYVAQEGALFPHLTAGENVGFGLPRAERRKGTRTAEALELVGLGSDYAGRRAHELSGGEQRRVALARALAPRPRLVLLDEPFSGLDAALRVETREAVVHALAEEGTTAVLVTHDQAEALSMGREVAVLREGRLVQRAAPTVLYREPVDLEVGRFVGDAFALPGHASSARVACALGDLELASPGLEGPVQVMVRPEQVRLVRRGGPGPDPTPPRVAATVIDYAYYGPDTVVRLALEAAPQPIVKARTFDRDVPDVGESVDLVVRGPVAAFPPETPPGGRVADPEGAARSVRDIEAIRR
jgi:iron(III) transport system ATP-binding protein